ncbi:GNAT family N-acetyltransferase [Mycolicibacterium sediminis]|uniref:N-acetyltransferase n=1 Tax=Mycolicibacterium sediminis TaxID=1286180 RepID=A0A7I7QTP4_9MYCO|nr:GNAT family N-acetyltransferase [Mycolicibacterium sediminis]BBY29684.1 N-acetyltransferase [Mycolicibacterium sediminis]
MSPTTVIRLAETDWRAFATLRLRALRDTLGTEDLQYRTEAAFTAARWRRRLRSHAQFAAVVDERMVGLIGAQRETADTVYLYSLWLEPTARRRGLGRELVASAVGWARSERARSVTLRVESANAAAMGVYEGLGFVYEGGPTASRPDEVTMRLAVS